MLKEEAVDTLGDKLRHSRSIRGNHRHARLLTLMNHEGRVLRPDRGNNYAVDMIKDVAHDDFVCVFGPELDKIKQRSTLLAKSPLSRLNLCGNEAANALCVGTIWPPE